MGLEDWSYPYRCPVGHADHSPILNTGSHSVVVAGRDNIISRPVTPHMGHVLSSLSHSGFGRVWCKALRIEKDLPPGLTPC